MSFYSGHYQTREYHVNIWKILKKISLLESAYTLIYISLSRSHISLEKPLSENAREFRFLLLLNSIFMQQIIPRKKKSYFSRLEIALTPFSPLGTLTSCWICDRSFYELHIRRWDTKGLRFFMSILKPPWFEFGLASVGGLIFYNGNFFYQILSMRCSFLIVFLKFL